MTRDHGFLTDAIATPALEGTVLALPSSSSPSPVDTMARILLRNPERLANAIDGSDIAGGFSGSQSPRDGGQTGSVPVWVSPAAAYEMDVLSRDIVRAPPRLLHLTDQTSTRTARTVSIIPVPLERRALRTERVSGKREARRCWMAFDHSRRAAASRGMIKGTVPRKSRKVDVEGIHYFREQMQFFRSSSAAYDAGNTTEALRLAVSLRVLLHDTPQSTSILSQLGVKTDLAFVNTALTPVVKEPDSRFVARYSLRWVMGVPDGGTAPGLLMAVSTPNDLP